MTIYTIDKRFLCRTERSARVIEIAEAFGLGLEDREFVIFDKLELEVKQGDIVYITGQSGSGKSLLLRELETQMGAEGKTTINIDNVLLENKKTVIDQIGRTTTEGLHFLNAAGLTDAYLYLRRPSELSDGQRYRFRLAKCVEAGSDVWVADEFMAVLDRTAAKIIAFSIQKLARKMGKTVIVATTHTDMVPDLQPSLYIDKRYKEQISIQVDPTGSQSAGVPK